VSGLAVTMIGGACTLGPQLSCRSMSRPNRRRGSIMATRTHDACRVLVTVETREVLAALGITALRSRHGCATKCGDRAAAGPRACAIALQLRAAAPRLLYLACRSASPAWSHSLGAEDRRRRWEAPEQILGRSRGEAPARQDLGTLTRAVFSDPSWGRLRSFFVRFRVD
jgi:hypothetical protein